MQYFRIMNGIKCRKGNIMIEISRVKSEEEMKIVCEIRMEVFVREQGVPVELEMDELDKESIHVLAYVDGVAAGCGRVHLEGEEAKIGRIAVRKANRRDGIGTGICKLLMSIAADNGVSKVYLGAQLSAIDFYAAMGFEKVGEVFLDAGIKHIKMFKMI